MYSEVKGAVFSTMFFFSNWHFFFENSYQALQHHPLRHAWSLGVEEQFYLVLPLVVLIAHLIAKTTARSLKSWLGIGATLVALLSLGGGIALVNLSQRLSIPRYLLPQSFAYLGTPSRAWELFAGVALASITVKYWSKRSKSILFTISLITLLFLGLFIDSWVPFPGLLSVPVVLATVFLIISVQDRGLGAVVLGWRPLVKLGDISYELYLVHWPIWVILGLEKNQSLISKSLYLIGCFALASVLYEISQRYIRRIEISDWRMIGAFFVSFAIMPVALARYLPEVTVDHKIEFANVTGVYEINEEPCENSSITLSDFAKCIDTRIGDRPWILLVGDSHAAGIKKVVGNSGNADGYAVFTLSTYGCPFLLADSSNRLCDTNRALVMGIIEEKKPNLVFLANAVVRYLSVDDEGYLPRGLQDQIRQVGAAYLDTFVFVSDRGIPMLVWLEVPHILDEGKFASSKIRNSINGQIRDSASSVSRVSVLDPGQIICPFDVCSRRIDGIDVYTVGDPEHINNDVSEVFSDLVTDGLKIAGSTRAA